MKRIYIKLSAKEIIELAPKLIKKNDYSNLEALEYEIGFRKKAAKKLAPTLEAIKIALKNKKDNPTSPSGQDEQPASPKPTRGSKRTEEPNKKTEQIEQLTLEEQDDEIDLDLLPEINEDNKGPATIGIHAIRPSGPDLTDTPQSWEPKPKFSGITGISEEELKDSSWARKFYFALNDLIREIKRSGSGKSIDVLPGKLIEGNNDEGGSHIYLFPVNTSIEDIFENAKVTLRIDNSKAEGRISAINLGKNPSIAISTDQYLGDRTGKGRIIVDNTANYEALKEKIGTELGLTKGKPKEGSIDSSIGLNFELAEKLMSNSFESCIDSFRSNNKNLNESQNEFINKAFQHNISFLWGPPGTGKTQTLSALIEELCNRNERTLICSNTNMAVDQVILKFAREEDNIHVNQGKVIRLGKVHNDDLKTDYFEKVTIDGIAEKRGSELNTKKNKIMSEREVLQKDNEELLRIDQSFVQLDNLKQEQQQLKNAFNTEQSSAKSKRDQIENLKVEENDLYKKYEERKNGGGGLRGFFGRTPEQLLSNIQSIQAQSSQLEQQIVSHRTKIKSIITQNESLIEKIEVLKGQLSSYSRPQISDRANRAQEKIKAFSLEIQELEQKIEEIKQVVIDEAIVIGTTLAKTHLKASDLGNFDNVIIDEASMGLLPEVYIASSLSKKRIVISGDFSQLSPICSSKNESIKNILGANIFDVSHIAESARNKVSNAPSNLSMLDIQYRMHQDICELISPFMYNDRLKTDFSKDDGLLVKGILESSRLTIIDTSTMNPFSSQTNTGSKDNPLNALVARNLSKSLIDSNPNFKIGYCTPFAAQRKIFNAISDDKLKKNIQAGTVHSYQGDEKDILIYDTVEAISNSRSLGLFLIATHENAEGAKLLNVAISRAKKHLVFIADLSTLDKKLPNNSFLRNVLYQCQNKGLVLDGRKVVDLETISKELSKSNFQPSMVDFDLPNSAMVNEDQFFPLLYADITNAKESIIIYSGFFTPKRIDEMLPVLGKVMSKGVVVRFVIPSNDTNGSFGKQQPEACERTVKAIRQKGIVVDQRARIHQKAVVIDSDIAWSGSLNPLSFGGKTLESMWTSREKGIGLQIAESLSLKITSKRNSIKDWAKAENPDCPKCNKATIYRKSRFGEYFTCEDNSCDGKVSPKRY